VGGVAWDCAVLRGGPCANTSCSHLRSTSWSRALTGEPAGPLAAVPSSARAADEASAAAAALTAPTPTEPAMATMCGAAVLEGAAKAPAASPWPAP